MTEYMTPEESDRLQAIGDWAESRMSSAQAEEAHAKVRAIIAAGVAWAWLSSQPVGVSGHD